MTGASPRDGRRVYVALVSLLLLRLGIYFLYPIRVVVLVLISTMLLASVLSAPVDYLSRKGLPRVWATLTVILALFVLLPLPVRITAPTVANQVGQLAADLPAIVDELSNLIEEAQNALGLGVIETDLDPEQLPQTILDYLSNISLTTVANVGSSAASVTSLAVVVLLVGVYSVLRPAPLVNSFVSMFPAGER